MMGIDIRQLGEEIPFGMQQARDFLELVLSVIEMLQLYKECFPKEFLCDLEQNVPIFPAPSAVYSQCEVNFFGLVNMHYFPLPMEFLPDDLIGERQMAERIPITCLGFDFYDESEYEELRLGWHLLLYLLDEVDEEWFGIHAEYASDDLFKIHIERGDYISEALLSLRCEAQGGVFPSLVLAIEVLQHETESVWLNVTMEDPCMDAFWTKEDMEEIRRQYHLAQEITAKIALLCEWLEEDPRKHFSLLARLWNSCVRDTPKRETGPRVMQIPAGAFVDGIQFGEVFGRYIPRPQRLLGENGG